MATATKASATTPMCVICDEKANKSTHTLVTCQYCPFEACRACCETYILSQSAPKCMEGKCGKEWTRKFLAQNFPNFHMAPGSILSIQIHPYRSQYELCEVWFNKIDHIHTYGATKVNIFYLGVLC
jgi:hypothetical protein